MATLADVVDCLHEECRTGYRFGVSGTTSAEKNDAAAKADTTESVAASVATTVTSSIEAPETSQSSSSREG
ncbi:hypothetical protein IscW_ISCW020242 [Ixodes scapularis]|uniref:Uncharacterized protein n=1 Tax=Ixodes scapularis TaxID=6945 RepID=B7Q1N3_IXOSC|nr:hypothetical protein IscW_ISCW020242 [Ixodes scapularis]|eukprot:XP_002409847.1 hypothetical protein IscW_ISCW020242 [Ixodes scapularis]